MNQQGSGPKVSTFKEWFGEQPDDLPGQLELEPDLKPIGDVAAGEEGNRTYPERDPSTAPASSDMTDRPKTAREVVAMRLRAKEDR